MPRNDRAVPIGDDGILLAGELRRRHEPSAFSIMAKGVTNEKGGYSDIRRTATLIRRPSGGTLRAGSKAKKSGKIRPV